MLEVNKIKNKKEDTTKRKMKILAAAVKQMKQTATMVSKQRWCEFIVSGVFVQRGYI